MNGNLIKALFRMMRLDVVSYSAEQTKELRRSPRCHYRDFVMEEALTLPVGETSLAEARFLGELLSGGDPSRPIIEIGTLFGWATKTMAMFKPVAQKLITVDNYSWNPLALPAFMHERITRQILAEASGMLNVRVVTMDKAEFYRHYQGPAPSLVYFDAIHTFEETKNDIQWAKEVSADIICGHDYDPQSMPGVVRAVQEFGGPSRMEKSLWVL
jgi:hypothetical protein